MAKRKWISSAIKHPGAATRAAKREGMSLTDWIGKHKGEGGTAGKRARLAKTLREINR